MHELRPYTFACFGPKWIPTWVVGILLFYASVAMAEWHSMDWVDGSAATTQEEWRAKMGVDWERLSCRVKSRRRPSDCVRFVTAFPRTGITKYFLYMWVDDPQTLAQDA